MASTWRKGKRIQGRWLVHDVLRGGMGIVYVVYDVEHAAVYAVKTFRDAVQSRLPGLRGRFRREAESWVKLELHPHIVRAGSFQEIEHRPCLFLEDVSGGDLTRWIGTPRLTEDPLRVLRFAFQFCDGMIHAAAKEIVAHRDIKPANCLLDGHGAIKITDFGLAKLFDPAEDDPGIERGEVAHSSTRESRSKLSASPVASRAPRVRERAPARRPTWRLSSSSTSSAQAFDPTSIPSESCSSRWSPGPSPSAGRLRRS